MRNSRRVGLLAAVSAFGLALAGMSANAETLQDAIALAYRTNPTVLNARSTLRNADENYFRTRIGQTDPTVTVGGVGVTLSDSQDLVHGGADGGGTLAFTLPSVSVGQTLYRGGGIAATMDQARNTLLTARENWRTQEMNLISSVVSAYTAVRQNEARVRLGAQSLENQRRSYVESEVKYNVGTETITSLRLAEATYARQEATYLGQQNNLANSRTQYLTVVGKMPESLDQEPDISAALPKTFEEAFQLAQQNSPTIRNAYLAERSNALALANAKTAYRPTANFSVGTQSSIGSRRFGNDPLCNSAPCFENFNSSLNASISITAPLWPGRATASNIRTAEENYRSAQNTLDNARRTLYQRILTDWNNLENDRRQIDVATKALDAQRVATQGAIEQNVQGITILTDRLRFEEQLASAEQASVDANFKLFTTAITLLQDTGTLSLDTLGVTGIDRYDPNEHFAEVNGRGNGGWADWVERLDRNLGVRAPNYVPQPGEVIPEFQRPG